MNTENHRIFFLVRCHAYILADIIYISGHTNPYGEHISLTVLLLRAGTVSFSTGSTLKPKIYPPLCWLVSSTRACPNFESLIHMFAIWRYGTLTLKFSVVCACHTTLPKDEWARHHSEEGGSVQEAHNLTDVTKRVPRLPWSLERFQTPLILLNTCSCKGRYEEVRWAECPHYCEVHNTHFRQAS